MGFLGREPLGIKVHLILRDQRDNVIGQSGDLHQWHRRRRGLIRLRYSPKKIATPVHKLSWERKIHRGGRCGEKIAKASHC